MSALNTNVKIVFSNSSSSLQVVLDCVQIQADLVMVNAISKSAAYLASYKDAWIDYNPRTGQQINNAQIEAYAEALYTQTGSAITTVTSNGTIIYNAASNSGAGGTIGDALGGDNL